MKDVRDLCSMSVALCRVLCWKLALLWSLRCNYLDLLCVPSLLGDEFGLNSSSASRVQCGYSLPNLAVVK